MENLLFFDIETRPEVENFEELDPRTKELWLKKSARSYPDLDPAESYANTGLMAEFGRICCVSIGKYKDGELKMKSYYGEDETKLLHGTKSLFDAYPNCNIVGFNSKSFDIPFLGRRLIANRLKIPTILNTFNVKPWEQKSIDLLEVWRCGEFRYYTSFDVLCNALGVESPKTEFDGSQVGTKFFEGKIEQIKDYCERDVIAVYECYKEIFKSIP